MIYLDHLASTPVAPEVVEAMQGSLADEFANPHAAHVAGRQAHAIVDMAAQKIASLIGAEPGEITFTSGASEANNLAIKGVALAGRRRGGHIVVSAVEHACVLEAARWLESQGFDVSVVGVRGDGIVDPGAVSAALRPDTALVSIQLANNEVGALQPIAAIASICRKRGVPFHTDAAQAVGKTRVDVSDLGIDLLSLSAHKFYGPKGIGALWIAADCPMPPEPIIHGGGQQGGRRAGTVPTFLCHGLGVAADLARKRLEEDRGHIIKATSIFRAVLEASGVSQIENGGMTARIPGCISIRFPGSVAQDVLDKLEDTVAASTGSACGAGSVQPSHVLLAMGMSGKEASETIRFGFGRTTTLAEAEAAARAVAVAVKAARRMAA